MKEIRLLNSFNTKEVIRDQVWLSTRLTTVEKEFRGFCKPMILETIINKHRLKYLAKYFYRLYAGC
jgi:hypothetical protein